MSRRKILLEFSTYAAALFLCISILVCVAHLWDADFSVPLCFEGDALFYQTLIKGIVDNGWVLHNAYIGMPTGFDLHDLPMADNLHFGLIKLISYFAHDSAVTLNIFAFLTFPLITITTLFVFRYFNLSRTSSIVASLLYTYLPYHFLRLGGHTLLSAYYGVPLATLVILWAFSGEPIFFHYDEARRRTRLSLLNSKALFSVVICLLVASTGIYYAFFACFFLAIVVISHLLGRKKKHSTLSAVILIALIFSGVLINVLPNLWYQFTQGPNGQAAVRSPSDAEVYGLKIAQLVLPSDYHRVSVLRKFKNRYNANAPLWNEGTTATLGIVASLGFFILLARIFSSKKQEPGTPLDLIGKLSTLNLSALLLATIGGFSSLFANLISPQIRGYNRISIYIAFFALLAFFWSYEAFFQKFKKTKISYLLFYSFLAFILAVGILDQTPSPHWVRNQPPSSYYYGVTNRSFRESYRQEADLIHTVETAVPANAMIFQLPYVPCPENPPVNRMGDYDHLRAYLHSNSLRWSYGAIKGRMTDGWQKAIAAKPIEEFVTWLSLSGFSGIYIDRFGYPDMGADLEEKLSKLLNIKPVVSSDKRLVFFNMSEFNKKSVEEREKRLPSPLLPVWGEGFSYLEDIPQGNRRWCASEGKFYIYNVSKRQKLVTLEMILATGQEKFSNLTIESPVYSGDFKVNGDGKFFSQTIRVPPGILVMRFKSDARRVTPPMDPRFMVFRVMNFRLTEGQDN